MQRQLVREGLWGLAAGPALFLVIMLLMAPLVGPAIQIPLGPRLLLAAAMFALGCAAGGAAIRWWFGAPGLRIAIAGGLSLALILLSIWLDMRAGGESGNPYVFGWPGMVTAVAATGLGGLVGGFLPARRPAANSPAGTALLAILLWVLLEGLVRFMGTVQWGALLGNPFGGDMLACLVLLLPGAALIARAGQKRGIEQADWGYRWDRRAWVTGLLAGVGLLAMAVLWPGDSGGFPKLPLWAMVAFLLGNGLAIPIAEEWVWRGVAQTALVRAYSPGVAVPVLALLFSLKHAVIDGSLGRFLFLFIFGIAVGVVRHKYGTGASTVAHIVANLSATILTLVL